MERSRYRRNIDIEEVGPIQGSWVCYVHGRLLCEALGLLDLLKPILEYQRAGLKFEERLSREGNYHLPVGHRYHTCRFNDDRVIKIRKSDFWVNIIHAFQSAGPSPRMMGRIKKKLDGEPNVVLHNNTGTAGTYVSFELAL